MAQNKRSKGEITKEKILFATLDLIAESGLGNVSHRNIAKKADVRLSLTSYYFGNLDNLLCEAYEEFIRREKQSMFALTERVIPLVNKYGDDLQANAATFIQELATIFTDHIESGTNGTRQKQIATESSFVFGLHYSDKLAKHIQDYHQWVIDSTAEMMALSGTSDPKADANIFSSAMRDLELSAASARAPFDRNFVHTCMCRLLKILFLH